MANVRKENIKRFMEDLSKDIAKICYEDEEVAELSKKTKNIKRFVEDTSKEVAEEVYPNEEPDEITD